MTRWAALRVHLRSRVEARRRHDERGAVALLVAAALVAMFGLAAIVVDLGNARDLVRQAQNAADAGALGAARVMAGPGTPDPAQAVAAGRQYVTANGGDGASATITIDTAAGTVDVRLAPQRAPGFFAGFIGAGTPDVAASAQARWRGQTSLPCALCVLGDYSGQVGTALVVRGSVAVNGALTFASAQGSLSVSPPGSGTIGYFTSYDGGGTVTPPPVKLAAPVADPFRALPLPPVEANSAVVARPGTGTCAPGVYTDVSNCTAFTGGGVYVLTGAPGMQTISINANAFDSLFYVTCHSVGRPPAREIRYAPCAAGVPPAQLFGAGRADATVTARTSGPYRGFAFVWDRGMVCPTPQCKQSLVGNARLVVEGVVYGPSVTLGAAGNGFWTTRGTVIAGGVSLAGVGVAGVHVEIDAGTAPPVVAVPSGPVQLSR